MVVQVASIHLEQWDFCDHWSSVHLRDYQSSLQCPHWSCV